MSLSLITLAAAMATQTARIEHRGTALEAVYSVRADIRQKTVGVTAPTRIDTRRCRWTATLVVERQLAGSAALARRISDEQKLSGSEHGACPRHAEAAERAVARRQDSIRSHLTAAIEQDRAPLLAELDAARSLASN